MGLFVNGFLSSSKRVLSPLSVQGCTLWLDANQGVYDSVSGGSLVTTDGSSIARWEDQSGNNYKFVQTTGLRQPVLSVNAQNNLNGISFNAKWLSGGQICNLEDKNFYIFLVHAFANSNQNDFQTIITKNAGYSSPTSGNYTVRRWDNTTAGETPTGVGRYAFRYNANNNFEVGVSDYTITTPTITTFSIPRNSGTSTTNLQLEVGDTTLATNPVNDTNINYNTNHSLVLGTDIEYINPTNPYAIKASTWFYGTIFEVIFYQRTQPLTFKEKAGIKRYLKNKWNV